MDIELKDQQKLDSNIKENAFARFGVTQPYTVFVLICVIILLGVFAFSSLKVELYPNMNLPYVAVISTAEGEWLTDSKPSNPFYNNKDLVLQATQMYTQMQEAIILQLVSNISSTQRTSSSTGSSTLFVEFNYGIDVEYAKFNVQSALFRIEHRKPFANFDMDVLPPEMLEGFREQILAQGTPPAMVDFVLETMMAQFAKVEFGIPIVIKMDPALLPVFTLTSTYKAGDADKSFYTKVLIPELKEKTAGVANVSNSIPTSTYGGFNLLNGKPSISIRMQKNSDAVTTETVTNIYATLDRIQADYPDFTYTVTLDQGTYINESVGGVLDNLIIGGVLAILIIFLFLRSWKMTLAIGIAIPLSIVGTFVLMHFMGIGLNLISMSGLALAVGLLVDNGIIVLENIFRLRQKGMSIRDATVKGASQIFNAIIAATLTTVSVFFPLFFVEGIIMEIFMDMVWVMIFSLSASLLVAVAFLPSIVSSFKIGEAKRENFLTKMNASIGNFFKRPMDFTRKYYNKALKFSIKNKWATVGVALLVFGGSIGLIFIEGFVIMPPVDTGEFSTTISINPTYFDSVPAAERSEYIYKTMEQHAIGLRTEFIKPANLGSNITLSVHYSAGATDVYSMMMGGSGMSLGIDFVLGDKHKFTSAEATQVAFETIMAYFAKGEDLYPEDKTELHPNTMFTSVSMQASMMGMGADSVVVTLAGPSQDAVGDTLDTIHKALWENPEIAAAVRSIDNNISSNAIVHVNKKITASLNIVPNDGYSISKVQSMVNAQVALLQPDFGEGIYQISDGFESQFNETFSQMGLALVVGLLLIYLIMVALLQSFKMPFIILITVPLAFTGGFILLAICGLPLSVAAIIGLLILMGVIINNGIVMLDYINRARNDGLSVRDAVIAGANVRARPILMTAISTVIALVPMAIGVGASGAMMAPVAIVAIGGFIYGTAMSLLVVPAFYSIFVRDKKIKKNKEDINEKDSGGQLENEQNVKPSKKLPKPV